ncbi:MAG: phenylalanine--tRNA ligase subunit alpha [Alphaproteobacteria bacterium]|nr:phenylalanine--tRNA ligase subunit alpha [Alphaproteobacteria bacterium]
MNNIEKLRSEILAQIAQASDLKALDAVRVAALGKSGSVSALMKTLGTMNPDERKTQGPLLNALKDEVTSHIAARESVLQESALVAQLAQESVDITLPARPQQNGTIHPISQTINELVRIFAAMGFTIAQGPDIEDDWHNFTALNFPPGHPAREMQDTFFLKDGGHLLRTHTSSVQIRYMEQNKPPIRTICFGRTYRSDWDMTHTPMFHQMECLMIDTNVTMAHLKGCLQDFVRAFFGIADLPVRFRPSFFPFVEPGAEVDIGYIKNGDAIALGRAANPADQKWMEVLGAGMVHPNVLKNCGIDPDVFQGFAFGTGLERLAMLKYGIPDLRTFFESDVRWLGHYGFSPLDAAA